MLGFVAWIACSRSAYVPGAGEDVTAPELPTTTAVPTTDTGDASEASGDLATVAELIAGRASAADVIPAVAWSGGWPVRDGDFAWFVAWNDTGPWAVAGEIADEDWVPQPMTEGDGFWWAKVEVGPDPAGLHYKLVGPGETWIADPFARSYTYDDNGEISYVAPPAGLARLDRWPGLAAEGLAARDLRVWVPAGNGPWPVLYAHDGQNLFDPGAIWGGWRMSEALAAREPILVVGIDNTVDRFDEYTHVQDELYGNLTGGDGDTYATFVEEHVRPHVEEVYGSTGLDGVLGSSLGGLISLNVAWRYPDRYDFAASLSGTLGWGRFSAENETIEERWLSAPPPGTAVYLDSGGGPGANGCQDVDGDGFSEDDPDASDNYCETRQLADDLAANGYVWETDLWHWWEPDAPHNEIAWAARVGMPLDRFLSLQ